MTGLQTAPLKCSFQISPVFKQWEMLKTFSAEVCSECKTFLPFKVPYSPWRDFNEMHSFFNDACLGTVWYLTRLKKSLSVCTSALRSNSSTDHIYSPYSICKKNVFNTSSAGLWLSPDDGYQAVWEVLEALSSLLVRTFYFVAERFVGAPCAIFRLRMTPIWKQLTAVNPKYFPADQINIVNGKSDYRLLLNCIQILHFW